MSARLVSGCVFEPLKGRGGLTRVLMCRGTLLDLPYPDLKEYIADMNIMLALIINGPV